MVNIGQISTDDATFDDEVNGASVSFTDSDISTSISSLGTFTQQIALGKTGFQEAIFIVTDTTTGGQGAIVRCTNTASEDVALDNVGYGGAMYAKFLNAVHLTCAIYDSTHTSIWLESAQIVGSNLELVWFNTHSTLSRTLNVYVSGVARQ